MESIPLLSYGSSSGAVTTTNALDLLVGATPCKRRPRMPGPSFTSRMITSLTSTSRKTSSFYAPGSFSATAPVTGVPGCVMQMVAFRAASKASDATPPTVAISSPGSGSHTDG